MTQLTMPDRAVPGAVRPTLAAARDVLARDVAGRDVAGWDGRDGADVATAVRALEARKALLAGAVAALSAPDRLAAGLFEAALADPGARLWPFDLARVHLLYGEWLRRARKITEARQHLQAALAVFEYEGAAAWADRAAVELAATGPTRQPAETGQAEPLTAQELQVAELAAAGLSNKQIGARLYLSHRTVGAHLYRIFPKLGISSRAALRDALCQRAAAGCAPTASAAAAAPAARRAPRPAGRPSPRPRPRSAPWSPGAPRPRTSPRRCSCPGARSRPTSPAFSPSSTPRAGSRSCARPSARASPSSRTKAGRKPHKRRRRPAGPPACGQAGPPR